MSDVKQLCRPLPLSVKCSCKRPAEWGGTEAREIDLHVERNYTDIPLKTHCSEGNQICVGIKRDVPSQISFDCARASDIFSFYQVDNLECACLVHYILCFHTWVQSEMASDRPQEIQFPVCLHYSDRKMNVACDVFDLQWKDKTMIGHCVHTEVHTQACDSLTTLDCSYPSPLLLPFASSPLHRHSLHLISVDPCLLPPPTAASPVKKVGPLWVNRPFLCAALIEP